MAGVIWLRVLRAMSSKEVMQRFRDGKLRVFVATDVASRGIDVDDVDAVFNYDVPLENEYYVHRIGRTGRAKRRGVAYTLVSGTPPFALLFSGLTCSVRWKSSTRTESWSKADGATFRCMGAEQKGAFLF